MTEQELREKLFPGRITGSLSTRKQLKKALDRTMSFWAVLNDNLQCVTCGQQYNLTASHLFKRGNDNARWEPKNIFCQCNRCNGQHNRNFYPLETVFRERYGQKALDELYEQWNQLSHFKQYHLIETLDRQVMILFNLFEAKNIPFEHIDSVRLKFHKG